MGGGRIKVCIGILDFGQHTGGGSKGRGGGGRPDSVCIQHVSRKSGEGRGRGGEREREGSGETLLGDVGTY